MQAHTSNRLSWLPWWSWATMSCLNYLFVYGFRQVLIRSARRFYFVGALLFCDNFQTHLGTLLFGRALLMGTLHSNTEYVRDTDRVHPCSYTKVHAHIYTLNNGDVIMHSWIFWAFSSYSLYSQQYHGESLTHHTWFEQISTRLGLGKPFSCLTSLGESNWLCSLPESRGYRYGARGMHFHILLRQYSQSYLSYNRVVKNTNSRCHKDA